MNSTSTGINGVKLAHHVSQARMVINHFCCFFLPNSAWYRIFRKKFQKKYHLQRILITFCGHRQLEIAEQLCANYINNSRHLARKCARIFVRGHYLFREANSFPRAKLEEICELRGTDKSTIYFCGIC